MHIINTLSVTNRLMNNVDDCIALIESLGYTQITYRQHLKELRFSREEGRNPSSMRFKTDTLKYNCFSTGEYGDYISLVMRTLDKKFPQALEYIAKVLGLSQSQLHSTIRLPFSGFYRKLQRELQEPENAMQTYDESILQEYLGKYNLMFFRDGISFQTQQEFQIGFDLESLRITVPEYTLDGQLCGIMGRLNDTRCPKEERWLPILPCSRNLTLYGYHRNYDTIQQKNTVIIGESEKFVQQLHSMGSYVALATCGCDISDTQAKYIKSLMTKKVILAYDEGLEEDRIRYQAEKLKVDNAVFRNRVGYIYDRSNEVLPKDSKSSPSDHGKLALLELVKKHITLLN